MYAEPKISMKRGTNNLMRMPTNLKQCVWILAAVLSMGTTGLVVRAATPPAAQDQAREQDYSKNKKYEQGMREGQNDRKRSRDNSKKKHFKKDEDQRAYETGYQRGHEGDQGR
jgi:hypothetical protein